MLNQTISLEIFWRLSSIKFTWSTLEYFVPYVMVMSGVLLWALILTFQSLLISRRSTTRMWQLEYGTNCQIHITYKITCIISLTNFLRHLLTNNYFWWTFIQGAADKRSWKKQRQNLHKYFPYQSARESKSTKLG